MKVVNVYSQCNIVRRMVGFLLQRMAIPSTICLKNIDISPEIQWCTQLYNVTEAMEVPDAVYIQVR